MFSSCTHKDLAENRLKLAKTLGADHTLLVNTGNPEELATRVDELLGGSADITIECCGAEPSIRLGIFVSICCWCCCVDMLVISVNICK